MKYQASPKWDKNRPIHLKLGFIAAIGFVLMAFNYTSHPPAIEPYIVDDWTEIEPEIIPPTSQSQPKALPPPPTPKIDLMVEVEPQDEPIFVENKAEEIFDEPAEETESIVDEYASPQTDISPVMVEPIAEEIIDEGPVLMADRMPIHTKCDLEGTEAERRLCTNTNIMESLYKTIKYPNYARDVGLEGTVVVSFVVSKTGDIENVEILKDIGAGCGDEVIKAVNKLGKFYPGKHNGRPVSVIHRLPVKFSLN